MGKPVRVSDSVEALIRNNQQDDETEAETLDRLVGVNKDETPLSKKQKEIIRSICSNNAVSQDELDDRIREIIETEYM